MVFSSMAFILKFMPIFFLIYYLAPNRCKNVVLLLGSLAFYFVGTIDAPYHFALFVFTIIFDFAIARGMQKWNRLRTFFLTCGILFHFGCLFLFKYAGFILSESAFLMDKFGAIMELVLPIGISFYTFQGVSYLVDVYRGNTQAESSLLNYAVYISMFPQLIAGPIVTYRKVERRLNHRQVSFKTALRGFGIFVFGLGLKVLLANPVGKLWTQLQAIGYDSISTPLAWMGLFAYTFQIYFDFFGYSLMAVGLGRMLGFRFPQNFKHPYTSLTMTEFWRRWHITLGSWFREYVYIPLGGNRKGAGRTILNLMIVWVLTGIWHGAGYNFLLWGFLLFAVLALEKTLFGKYLEKYPILGHIYMIVLIPLFWAVFAIEDISQLGLFFTRLFPFFGQSAWSIFRYDYLKYLGEYWYLLALGALFSTKLPYKLLKRIRSKVVIAILLAAILVGSLYCIYRGFDDPFLYFRF